MSWLIETVGWIAICVVIALVLVVVGEWIEGIR